MAGERTPGSGGLSRRSFLMSVAGTVMGAYVMPAVDYEDAVEELAPTLVKIKDRVRDIYLPPDKVFQDEHVFQLLWTERIGEYTKAMIWYAEDSEELAEMQHFYEGARGYHLVLDEAKLPPVPERGPEEQKLIDAVLDNTDDLDAQRRYGEWLQRRGSTLGEHMVVCVDLERMDEDDPRYEPLDDRRFFDLYQNHVEEWFAPLKALFISSLVFGDADPMEMMAPGGFIQSVWIARPGILPEFADYLFRAAPLIHSLKIEYESIDVESIAKLPQLANLEELAIAVGNDSQMRALANAPHLRRLEKLYLSDSAIGERGGALLGGSRILPRLRVLDLESSELGTAGLKGVLRSPRPLRLTTLHLGYNDLDDEALATLARTQTLRHLVELSVSGNMFTAEGVTALREASFIGHLERLFADSCELDAKALGTLASLPFESLEVLWLDGNVFGDAGLRALKGSPLLHTIRHLQLGMTNITAHGVTDLLQGSGLEELTRWDISVNSIGPKGFEAIARSPALRNLVALEANKTACKDSGLKALANSTNLAELAILNLKESDITAAGARALANSTNLPNLSEVDLSENHIGVEGVHALANARGFENITSLTIDESAVGERERDMLLERFDDNVVQLFNA